jgi:hypothetical protein
VGELDGAIAFGQIFVVRPLDNPQMVLKGRDQAFMKHRHPALFSLAVADEDLMLGEVQVFDAQTLHQPQAAAAEELGRKLISWMLKSGFKKHWQS